jgi:hypothetical protein
VDDPELAARLRGPHQRRWGAIRAAVFTITTAGEAAFRHDSLLGRILDAAFDSDEVEREPGLTIGRMRDARTLVWEYAARRPTRTT